MNAEFTLTLKIKVILITEHTTRFNFNLESTLYTNDLLKPADETGQEQEKKGPFCDDHIGGDLCDGFHQPIEKESFLEVPYIPLDRNLDISDKDLNILKGDEAFEKLPIVLVSFILGIKIFENILYIVIKVGIYIYFKNLRKARVL